jgi:hypothetical protein
MNFEPISEETGLNPRRKFSASCRQKKASYDDTEPEQMKAEREQRVQKSQKL